MKRLLIILAAFFCTAEAHAASGVVAVSIKPLHSLVAAVMQGDGNTPLLLVDGKESLHHFTLKPSQVKALQQAKLVFYISDDFEPFLTKTLDSLPQGSQRVLMANVPALTLHNVRSDEDFGAPEGPAGKRKRAGFDFHLWLAPSNAKAMIMEITRQLAIAFPEHKPLYFTNARHLSTRLDSLGPELERRVGQFRSKPFIVFHDAIQYFEKAYGLQVAGAVTLHPEQGISAARVQSLRDKIKTHNVACVFREPEFEGRVIDNLIEGTGAKSGLLDPEGALLAPGPELYFQLLEGLAAGLEQCFTQDAGATSTPNGA